MYRNVIYICVICMECGNIISFIYILFIYIYIYCFNLKYEDKIRDSDINFKWNLKF